MANAQLTALATSSATRRGRYSGGARAPSDAAAAARLAFSVPRSNTVYIVPIHYTAQSTTHLLPAFTPALHYTIVLRQSRGGCARVLGSIASTHDRAPSVQCIHAFVTQHRRR